MKSAPVLANQPMDITIPTCLLNPARRSTLDP
jgi:hypothetical protein